MKEWEQNTCIVVDKKKALLKLARLFKIGIDILSRALDQVPSAQVGLTSLFGMGRGDPHRNRRHKGLVMVKVICWRLNVLSLTINL